MIDQDLSRFTISSKPVDEEKEKFVFSPSETIEEKKPFFQYFMSNPLWIGVYVILLFVAIVAGVYLFRTANNSGETTFTALPSATPVLESSPSAAPTEEQ